MCGLIRASRGAIAATNASSGSRTSARYRSLSPQLREKAEELAGHVGHARSDRPMQPAVDVDALAGDVARLGRAQARGEKRQIGGVAEIAERNIALELGLALGCRVQALIDLLAVEPAGRQAVDRDPV